MKRPAELDDLDRNATWRYANRTLEAVGERPMSKRIPSPYTTPEPPKAERREYGAAIAGMCLVLGGATLTLVGAIEVGRWIWEAVR